MTHGHQLDGMGMNSGLITRVGLNLTGMNGEVTGQFAGGHHSLVGNDDIRGAIVEDADDRAIGHRPAGQVAHTLASTLTVEITALEGRQCDANLLHVADGRHTADLVIGILRDVHRDITTITLGPSVLPQITGHLCYFLDLCLQGRTSV